MTARRDVDARQLGFGDLLQAAEADNAARLFDRRTAHLPGDRDSAISFFGRLIEAHHAAMLAADVAEAMRLREEAHHLAVKLNGGEGGICAHDDAPAYVLARATAAPPGAVPRWGQTGTFTITAADVRVRIELEGIFGIGSSVGFWPGFAAHAVEVDRPFLSPPGSRSFLGIHAEPVPGLTPPDFAGRCIAAHFASELRGRLVRIEERYRDRCSDAA